MSYVPGDKSEDPQIHFEAGMRDFTRFDKVRLINITGSIQYGILYSIAYFIVGVALHNIFPAFTTNISLLSLFGWILLQCIVIIIVIFYIKKFIEAIPGLAAFFPSFFNVSDLRGKGFIPYGIDEFRGDMAANIVLIGTQYRLLEKVAYLTKEVSKRYL
jgi:hypothetical protein